MKTDILRRVGRERTSCFGLNEAVRSRALEQWHQIVCVCVRARVCELFIGQCCRVLSLATVLSTGGDF